MKEDKEKIDKIISRITAIRGAVLEIRDLHKRMHLSGVTFMFYHTESILEAAESELRSLRNDLCEERGE